MWEWVRSLPNDWMAGMEAPPIQVAEGPWQAIVTVGMGGSAFGAEVVRSWAEPHLAIPWVIVRDYHLPRWVGARTLVLACSYSGTTEETLEATEAALERGATVVGIASGGTLRSWGESGRLAGFILLPEGRPPRAAVPFSITAQLRLLEGLALIPATWRSESEALIRLLLSRDHPSQQELRALTEAWASKCIAIYAPTGYESIALRARQQIQENAKHIAWHHTIPEMNHNELVGWEHPSPLSERIAIWLLSGSHTHPRNLERIRFMEGSCERDSSPFTSFAHLQPPTWPS